MLVPSMPVFSFGCEGFEDQLLSLRLVVEVVPFVRSVEEFRIVRCDVHHRNLQDDDGSHQYC